MQKILCLTVFVLLTSASVFAQEKTIPPTEFETAYKNASLLLSGKARRMIRTVQSTVEVMPESNASGDSNKTLQSSTISIKSTTEILPSVGFRSVYELNSSSVNTKKEIIRIGNKTYTREGNGEWIAAIPQVTSKSGRTARRVDTQIEYKSVGTEKMGNQNANIYAKT